MKLDKPTFAVSTRADSLAESLKKLPQIITVWIRSGKFKNKMPIIRSAVTYEAKSRVDAKDYTKRFVSVFPIPKTHTKLSVLKGISKSQITQLITYTKSDRFIRTRTHDFDYFRSRRTFLTWMARGKTIYTLVNRSEKLLGIIWFAKGVRTTRIYPPARGKKISKKFLEVVRKDYKANSPKLTVLKNS